MNFKNTKHIVFNDILHKCYAYSSKRHLPFPNEYSSIYKKVTHGIESMDCAENVRAVMRLRYRDGRKFTEIAQLLGITYQWVYELHKIGTSLLEKHLSF